MLGGIIILLLFLSALAGMIAIAEFRDRRECETQKRIFQDGIRCKGKVVEIQRKGILESRSAYPWKIAVEFEFDGNKYRLEEQSISKPLFIEGDSIVVYVDRKDPNNSKAAI